MSELNTQNPHQIFEFFAEANLQVGAQERAALLLRLLVASRDTWTLGPPSVDVRSDGLHGRMQLHSALPPWGAQLAYETDETEFQQVCALVGTLETISGELHLTIELELDGNSVGRIQDGVSNRGVREVLLGEWQRVLKNRRPD